MADYSILSFNFNNYEILREPKIVDETCDYMYVTDDKTLKSNKWKIILDSSLDGLSPFEKCCKVRYNPFYYVNSPVCIVIDGSIQIHKSLRKLYNDFIGSNSVVGFCVHPDRTNFDIEYQTWVSCRNYPIQQMEKCLSWLKSKNYNLTYQGLYQTGVRICKAGKTINEIDGKTFEFLKELGTSSEIERIDQIIYSFVLNQYYNEIPVFPFSQQIFQSEYMSLCGHGSRYALPPNKNIFKDCGYVFNKLVKLYKI